MSERAVGISGGRGNDCTLITTGIVEFKPTDWPEYMSDTICAVSYAQIRMLVLLPTGTDLMIAHGLALGKMQDYTGGLAQETVNALVRVLSEFEYDQLLFLFGLLRRSVSGATSLASA
jgi:hypothetical protein